MNPLSDLDRWQQIACASEKEWGDGSAIRRALDLWCEENGLGSAALLLHRSSGAMETLQTTDGFGELGSDDALIELSDDLRLAYRGDGEPTAGPLGLVVGNGLRLGDLHGQLKNRVFQENYRVVTLEALYDVGLAIASTLNLDELTEEILLRAVSLSDARRGALYLLEDESFVLSSTIGGDAVGSAPRAGGERFKSERAVELLPGASFALAVPIEVEGAARGILVVGDKESRVTVGPFSTDDERALSMFANQAAIALENARLHRQALEKERLEREMELAAEIQRGLLPQGLPRVQDLEVVGWNRPTQQVGGDYYGSITLDEGRLGLVVADVTGKGMPAALLVSTLHSALKLLLDKVDPGADLLERLNSHVVDSSSSNKFITLIMAIADPQNDRLGFLNAGHNPGLRVTSSGDVHEMQPSGLPLGLLPGSTYRLDEAPLEPGDLFCLYSDGITECAAPDDEEFGDDRLREFLVERRHQPLNQILKALDDAVVEFAGDRPQGDDQTVVLLRRAD
ncbi:MAG: GAF domain-containing SpoIIE family protein phosphatase [Acidobacteriota bacterium]